MIKPYIVQCPDWLVLLLPLCCLPPPPALLLVSIEMEKVTFKKYISLVSLCTNISQFNGHIPVHDMIQKGHL